MRLVAWYEQEGVRMPIAKRSGCSNFAAIVDIRRASYCDPGTANDQLV
jgi:hypothetical protein